MAEKITLTDDNHYGPGNFDLAASPHKNTWTDGLPHDFRGWGPQTPDPQDSVTAKPAPTDELVWQGGDDHHNHYVWHFDGRRHRHH